MLMTFGVDSQFTSLEGLLTVLFDNKYIAKIRKEIVVGNIICLFFSMCVISIFVYGKEWLLSSLRLSLQGLKLTNSISNC